MTDQGLGPEAWQPLGYASAGVDQPFLKWRTGGIVFGIIAIVIGAGSGCLGLLVPLTLLAPQSAANQTAGAIVAGALLYLGIAGALIWVGIGAIKMRRWVRPIMLILGSLILILGVFFFAAMGLMFSVLAKSPQANPAMRGAPSGFYPIFLITTGLITAFTFLIIPGAFVWFYKKHEVKGALEHFDPTPRWTDRCPIPVLGIVMTLVCYAGMALFALPQGILPVFGTVLHGAPAIALQIIFVAIAIVLARFTFLCRMAGWWGTMGLVVLLAIAYAMTSLRSDQGEMYRAAGFNAQQLEVMNQLHSSHPFGFLAIQAASAVLMIGYLAYARKYFSYPDHGAVVG